VIFKNNSDAIPNTSEECARRTKWTKLNWTGICQRS